MYALLTTHCALRTTYYSLLTDQMRQRNARAAVERATLYPNHGGYAQGGYAHGGYARRAPAPGPGGGRAAAVATAATVTSPLGQPLGRTGHSTPPRSAPGYP